MLDEEGDLARSRRLDGVEKLHRLNDANRLSLLHCSTVGRHLGLTGGIAPVERAVERRENGSALHGRRFVDLSTVATAVGSRLSAVASIPCRCLAVGWNRTALLAPLEIAERDFREKRVGENVLLGLDRHGEEPERVQKSLALFEEIGCNMVRCWGGNIYEDDEFFDWCDEHGLLVWQDFMFACETAPQDDAFLEEVRIEAESVITALRHHPSLALWCGDNECDEWIYYSPSHRKILPSQNRITRETLPRAVQLCDPMRDFLPSSPYLCDRAQRIHDQYIAPEQHLWSREVWKGTFFKDNNAAFASEIGYLGMSDLSSIEKFIPKEELSDTQGLSWICHSTQPFGDRKGPWSNRISIMERAVKGFFGSVPEKLQSFVICSQIVQAEAFKYFVELFRAKKWNKSGIIWWNMIDCWPQISFSVVDYYYVRKLAFYYLKTAQQPLNFIIGDPNNWCCRLIADNNLPEPVSGTFKVSDLMTGETFAEGGFSIPADTAADVTSFPVSGEEQRMLLIEWEAGGRKSYNHFMLGNAPVKPELYLQWLDKLDELIYRPLGRNEWSAGDYEAK